MDGQTIVTLTQTLGFPAVCLFAILYGLYKLGLRILQLLEPHLNRVVERHIRFLDDLAEKIAKIDDIHVVVTDRKTEPQIETINRQAEGSD